MRQVVVDIVREFLMSLSIFGQPSKRTMGVTTQKKPCGVGVAPTTVVGGKRLQIAVHLHQHILHGLIVVVLGSSCFSGHGL